MNLNNDTKILYSLSFWLDHLYTVKGDGVKARSGKFFPQRDNRLGVTCFASQGKQWAYDSEAATIPSGCYVSGVFTPWSPSFVPDFDNGRVIAPNISSSAMVSGDYVTKSLNVYLSNKDESDILNEKEYLNSNIYTAVNSGIAPYGMAIPASFVFVKNGYNEPIQLGDTDNQRNFVTLRVITISNDSTLIDSAHGLMRKQQGKSVRILEPSQTPLNEYGNIKSIFSGEYRFSNTQTGVTNEIFSLEKITTSRIEASYQSFLPQGLKCGVADFKILYIGSH